METTEVKLSKHRVGRNIVVGQKFGDWTIVSYHSIKNGKAKWVCRCKCGKEANQLIVDGHLFKSNCATEGIQSLLSSMVNVNRWLHGAKNSE